MPRLAALVAQSRRIARHLPVEHDGATRYIAVEDVVAIHANAHYTTIFDGHAKLFCPLAIGDLESRLDKDRFIRVHRSHIVNIERVTGHKRAGDTELVEMAAAERYTVPVSRSRVAMIKARIGAKGRRGGRRPSRGLPHRKIDASGRIFTSAILTQFVQTRRHSCKCRCRSCSRSLLLRRTARHSFKQQ